MAGPNISRWRIVLTSSLLFASGASAQDGAAQSIQLSSSLFFTGLGDVLPQSDGSGSRCQRLVQNALPYNQSSIMFVPNTFYEATTNSIINQIGVSHFCLNTTGDMQHCPETIESQINAYTAGVARCFQDAVNAGLDIAVNPHLLGQGWANTLVFDPLARYGSWSYAEAFLYPIADALAQVMSPTSRIRFAMQGQMSASVVFYPAPQRQLLTLLKDRLLRSTLFPRANIQVGVSTHFNKICGCVLVETANVSQYLQQLPAALATFQSNNFSFDLPAIRDLYDAADFIGVTSYPETTPNFTAQELETATEQFSEEMFQFGVNISDLNGRQGKPLYWDEFGIGGAIQLDSGTTVKAPSVPEAAASPYFAVYNKPYSKSSDPWAPDASNQTTPLGDFRKYFFSQAITYATTSQNASDFKYKVAGIFVTTHDSWDVLGISPESTQTIGPAQEQGSYRDQDVAQKITKYNSQIRLAKAD